MKPVACAADEALDEILALPEDDPRRRHLEECPRCKALVSSYRSFMNPSDDEELAYGEREREVLDEARECLIGTVDEAKGSRANRARSAIARAPRRSWFMFVTSPPRPVLALAGLALLIAGAFVMPRLGERAPAPAVRGLGRRGLSMGAPLYATDGDVRLSWSGSSQAKHYEVRFFSTALEPLGQVDAGPDTTILLTAARMPAAFTHGGQVLYRVAALSGRDEMAISGTGTLQRP